MGWFEVALKGLAMGARDDAWNVVHLLRQISYELAVRAYHRGKATAMKRGGYWRSSKSVTLMRMLSRMVTSAAIGMERDFLASDHIFWIPCPASCPVDSGEHMVLQVRP